MKRTFQWIVLTVLFFGLHLPVQGQLSDADIAALREQGRKKGWTFKISKNPATQRPVSQLAGLVIPADAPAAGIFDVRTLAGPQPAAFDWREKGAVTSIKDQGGCGSCWAFAACGAFESAIQIKEGLEEDLSEQWLVSCTNAGNCAWGGWHYRAYEYFLWNLDMCSRSGAVLEADFPYLSGVNIGTVADPIYPGDSVACDCPYTHRYWIRSFGPVATDYWAQPSRLALKQAIMEYGPIAVSVEVNMPFMAYGGGVFNACDEPSVGLHAVPLVGWDDNEGTDGVWIMKNSWGTSWGENGYMLIEYDCLNIGYGAAYLDYASRGLEVIPATGYSNSAEYEDAFVPDFITYTLLNNGTRELSWQAEWNEDWVEVSPTSGILMSKDMAKVNVRVNALASQLLQGEYTDTVVFTNLSDAATTEREVRLSVVDKKVTTLSAVIEPVEAVLDGAKWRATNLEQSEENPFTDSVFLESGELLPDLLVGSYKLSFRSRSGWTTPADIVVTREQMESQQLTVVTARYTQAGQTGFTVEAGADQSVSVSSPTATLIGTAHGGLRPYTFQWSVSHWPSGGRRVTFVKLPNVYTSVRTTIGGNPAVPGDYIIELTGTDSAGHTAADTMTISVVDDNSVAGTGPTPPAGQVSDNNSDNSTPTQGDTGTCAAGAGQAAAMALLGLLFLRFGQRRRIL